MVKLLDEGFMFFRGETTSSLVLWAAVRRRPLSDGSGSAGSGKSGIGSQFCCPKCGAPFEAVPSFVSKIGTL